MQRKNEDNKKVINNSFKVHTIISTTKAFEQVKLKPIKSVEFSEAKVPLIKKLLPVIEKGKKPSMVNLVHKDFVTIQNLHKTNIGNPRNVYHDDVSKIPKTSVLPALNLEKDKESIFMGNDAIRANMNESPKLTINIKEGKEYLNTIEDGVISYIPMHQKQPIFKNLFERFDKYKEKHKYDLMEYYRKLYGTKHKRIGYSVEERENAKKLDNSLAYDEKYTY